MSGTVKQCVLFLLREGVAAGVFGSVARGGDTADSDVDMVVRFSPGIRHDVSRLAGVVERLIGAPVDVVDMDRLLERFAKTGLDQTILTETQPP